MKPEYWNEANIFLSMSCPKMEKLVSDFSNESLKSRGAPFYTLIRSIVGQQISVKAADSVWNKLELKLKKVTPQKILKSSFEDLRACGLSQQKIKYLYSAAESFKTNKKLLHGLSNSEIYEELIKIKGVGRWTAEMVLIFGFMDPDIFPIGDIGLKKGVEKLYFEGNKIDNETLDSFGIKFKPYRTVATWYLWRSLDPVPVEY